MISSLLLRDKAIVIPRNNSNENDNPAYKVANPNRSRHTSRGKNKKQISIFFVFVALFLFYVIVKQSVEHANQSESMHSVKREGESVQESALLLRRAFQEGLPVPPQEPLSPAERYEPKKPHHALTPEMKFLQRRIGWGDNRHPHENKAWDESTKKQDEPPTKINEKSLSIPRNRNKPIEQDSGGQAVNPFQRYNQQKHKQAPLSRARQSDSHPVAGLFCQQHGGPYSSSNGDGLDADQVVADMVYWRDIPHDAKWKSPHAPDASLSTKKYLTFEPDEGGFNNIRMAFETAVVLAVGTGRILVLPPEMNFYLLTDPRKNLKTSFGFSDFYDLAAIAKEQAALEIMSFEDFLKETAMQGQLINRRTGKPSFPPMNITNWNGMHPNFLAFYTKAHSQGTSLWHWMRKVTWPLDWNPEQCVAAIPKEPGPAALKELNETWLQLMEDDEKRAKNLTLPAAWKPGKMAKLNRFHSFDNNPTKVDASPKDRLAEMLSIRDSLCIYNETLQDAKVVHLKGEQKSGNRMLIHSYAFLFFQDWKQDLWAKRFVRDHLRYHDDIQCAAARIVHALRTKSREMAKNKDGANDDEEFHTMHVRRGDFQYKPLRNMTAAEIAASVKNVFKPGKILYIATDEKDRSFFEPFDRTYHVFFMNDFEHLLKGIDSHYFGMVDQLVAAQGDVFCGVFYSTFTGYINRLRGYLSQRRKLPGYKLGRVESYYYVPPVLASKRDVMLQYQALEPSFWQQEFPVAWRDLDYDVEDLIVDKDEHKR